MECKGLQFLSQLTTCRGKVLPQLLLLLCAYIYTYVLSFEGQDRSWNKIPQSAILHGAAFLKGIYVLTWGL